MTAGRNPNPPTQTPSLVSLVEALAQENQRDYILSLCYKWGIPSEFDPHANFEPIFNLQRTIRALARRALEYSRTQPEILPDCAGDLVDEYSEDM